MNQLNSLSEYEEFIYGLPQRFPAIAYSTLLVVRRGAGTALVRGEVIFSGGARLVVSERLMLADGVIQIVSYGYEVWRGTEKVYWYDSQPHPGEATLRSTPASQARSTRHQTPSRTGSGLKLHFAQSAIPDRGD